MLSGSSVIMTMDVSGLGATVFLVLAAGGVMVEGVKIFAHFWNLGGLLAVCATECSPDCPLFYTHLSGLAKIQVRGTSATTQFERRLTITTIGYGLTRLPTLTHRRIPCESVLGD